MNSAVETHGLKLKTAATKLKNDNTGQSAVHIPHTSRTNQYFQIKNRIPTIVHTALISLSPLLR